MRHSIHGGTMRRASALTVALMLAAAPNMALAKRGGDGDKRSAFYGFVQERPEQGRHGDWVIGGRTVATDAGTEFDQSEGPLRVGSCAKVHIRNGRIHEIDSEPIRNCR